MMEKVSTVEETLAEGGTTERVLRPAPDVGGTVAALRELPRSIATGPVSGVTATTTGESACVCV
jgi:hypothetical protein